MTTAFADSSALVKLYVTEPGGSSHVEAMSGLAVSALSRVEVVSAVRRKQRSGELAVAHANTICLAVDADFDDPAGGLAVLTSVAISEDLLQEAATLLARHALSASDAVQLSSAMSARDADPGLSDFACYDVRLRRAAAVEGFRVLPPTVPGD